jgi:hypothetical protein
MSLLFLASMLMFVGAARGAKLVILQPDGADHERLRKARQ